MMARQMAGKVVLVTGATSGMGRETALALAEMAATVVIHGRNKEKTEAIAKEIRSKIPGAQVEVILADFSKLSEVKEMADEFKRRFTRLDILVNNAGLMTNKKSMTADGHEMMFQVNFLAPFLLTCRLMDLIERSAPSRIVIVSSAAHGYGRLDFDDIEFEEDFGSMKGYGRSKLEDLVFTYELARRLNGKQITVNALHPGLVRTNLCSSASRWWCSGFRFITLFGRTARRGAETAIYLASSPEAEGITGKYFANKHSVKSSARSYDEASWVKLWETAERMLGESCKL